MPNLGVSELLVIFLMLLLVFGGSRLPQLGESLGRTIRGFKRGISNDERIQVVGQGEKPAEKPADNKPALDKDSSASSTATPSKREATDAELIDKS